MEYKTFNKGKVIFHEGDEADCMLLVATGKVGVYGAYGTAREKLLGEYYPDQFLGEMGLLEHETRSATAVAMEDSTSVAIVSEANFSEYFSKKPPQILKLMQQLSKNLRSTSKAYLDVCREVQELAAKEEQ